MFIVLVGGIFISAQRMKKDARAAHKSVETQVTNRVNESLKLLESLAVQPEYYDPSLPPLKKVEKLDRITEKYGYMMICYVDADMNVYTIGEEPASLASRAAASPARKETWRPETAMTWASPDRRRAA